MNWEIGIDVYTLICIKEITNKNLLYKKIEIQKKKKKEMLSTKKVDIFIAEITQLYLYHISRMTKRKQ